MELHPVDILISIINIIVLFVLLRLLLWKHILRYLSERSKRISDDIDTATSLRRDAEALEHEYKHKLHNMEEQGQEIIRESRAKADEEAEEIRKEAKAEVDEMMREARFRIELEREQALQDAQADIIQLATEMASKILKREVSVADNELAVDEFFDDLE